MTKPLATAHWLPRFDFILSHPVSSVWPLIVNWDRWIDDYACRHVSGTPDQAGQIKEVSKLDAQGQVQGTFRVHVVLVIPQVRLVYQIMQDGKPFGIHDRIQGYEVFNLYDQGAQTLVTYETVAHYESSQVSQPEYDAYIAQAYRNRDSAWQGDYVPKLRTLLAGR